MHINALKINQEHVRLDLNCSLIAIHKWASPLTAYKYQFKYNVVPSSKSNSILTFSFFSTI